MEHTRGRLATRLLLVANLAAATLAAATGVVAFIKPNVVGLDPTAVADAIKGEQRLLIVPLGTGLAWLLLLGSIALLLCNFAWLVRRAPEQTPRTYVTSETATGPVRVAREAIESGLRTAGETLPEITRLRVVVDCSQPKKVLVRGFFQCAEGVSNLNASQRLRQALRERFDDMVHLADGMRTEFELEFQGFLGKLTKKEKDSKAAQEAEPPPFTGPKYPIEDDEGGGSP